MADDISRTGGKADVQYYDSDFSFEEHAAECAATWDRPAHGDTSSASADNDNDNLLPQAQSKAWDAFHSHHAAGNFYKPRRYLLKSFPCILQYLEHGSADITEEEGGDRILLEIGCGSGSSCIPILQQCVEIEGSKDDDTRCVLLACDSSTVAVETTCRFVERVMAREEQSEAKPNHLAFGTFVADPGLIEAESSASLLREVASAYDDLLASKGNTCPDRDQVEGGITGIILMVFVLSAVTPSRVPRFLEQVYQTTKPGGKVCFRDYGLYDMPMLRFDPAAACKSSVSDDHVFVRGEGTIARFFSVESTREIFESAGFSTVELRYCTVYNHNRKTGQKLKRVFVHGVFEKPR